MREASTLAILLLEIVFFGWYLWPDGGSSYHPFLNGSNALLVLKYSSIYGIAAIGAAIVIISGGIDLSPGAVIALASVVTGGLLVDGGWGLAPSIAAGLLVGVVSGLLDLAPGDHRAAAAVHRHARARWASCAAPGSS